MNPALTFEEVMHISANIDTEKNAGLYALAKAVMEKATLAERERCAKLCESMRSGEPYDPENSAEERAYQECAAAIRADPEARKSPHPPG